MRKCRLRNNAYLRACIMIILSWQTVDLPTAFLVFTTIFRTRTGQFVTWVLAQTCVCIYITVPRVVGFNISIYFLNGRVDGRLTNYNIACELSIDWLIRDSFKHYPTLVHKQLLFLVFCGLLLIYYKINYFLLSAYPLPLRCVKCECILVHNLYHFYPDFYTKCYDLIISLLRKIILTWLI